MVWRKFFGGGDDEKKKDGEGDESEGSTAVKASMGQENTFYYNDELKSWVNRGEEDIVRAALAAKAAPPPKLSEVLLTKHFSEKPFNSSTNVLFCMLLCFVCYRHRSRVRRVRRKARVVWLVVRPGLGCVANAAGTTIILIH